MCTFAKKRRAKRREARRVMANCTFPPCDNEVNERTTFWWDGEPYCWQCYDGVRTMPTPPQQYEIDRQMWEAVRNYEEEESDG
jgi:hypothetical protein